MICTAPESHIATTSTSWLVTERLGRQPLLLQSSDTPLLDWIAGELRESQGEPASFERDQARRILEQAFAAVA